MIWKKLVMVTQTVTELFQMNYRTAICSQEVLSISSIDINFIAICLSFSIHISLYEILGSPALVIFYFVSAHIPLPSPFCNIHVLFPPSESLPEMLQMGSIKFIFMLNIVMINLLRQVLLFPTYKSRLVCLYALLVCCFLKNYLNPILR